jgi:DNA-binding HxlR family transcriptional regulator
MRFDRDTSNCSIARTLEIVGEKWTILILREIWFGAERFSEFEQTLGCANNLLAERLRTLVAHDILTTEPYREPGARTRHRYRLTDKGNSVVPILVALTKWGDENLADEFGPPTVLLHRGCGAPIALTVRCEHDHEIVGADEVDLQPGPGARLRDGTLASKGRSSAARLRSQATS